MLRPGNWTRPAGVSPARVIAREPGSRPRLVGETRRLSGASRASLEGARARTVAEASPAASSHLRRGSRAAHVTAKATSGRSRSGLWAAGSLRGTDRYVLRVRSGTGETRLR